MHINSHTMSFDGRILERGFWLYIWEIFFERKKYFYVGRTGDSSSPNASSPFNRIGQHLDFRPNAKGNALAKRLKEAGINPKSSRFRMLALGPIFQEQDTFESHKPYRDQMATFEYELASHLRSHGLAVLGIHHKGSSVTETIIDEMRQKALDFIYNNSRDHIVREK